MNTTVDGEYQRYAVEGGELHPRQLLRARSERLRQMVSHLDDDELRNLPRGGHDYKQAVRGLQGGDREPGQRAARP